ncbi:MAG: hypothetical protein KID02_04950 [Clostridiales bacterium]|nr:hypothetical protein [Clostridiales bacterium]
MIQLWLIEEQLKKIWEENGAFLQDILAGYAGLIHEVSIRDNCYVDPTTHLKIMVDLEKMKRHDPTVQWLLDNNIIQQAPQPFKLFFLMGLTKGSVVRI